MPETSPVRVETHVHGEVVVLPRADRRAAVRVLVEQLGRRRHGCAAAVALSIEDPRVLDPPAALAIARRLFLARTVEVDGVGVSAHRLAVERIGTARAGVELGW
jgi:hypothetical protein